MRLKLVKMIAIRAIIIFSSMILSLPFKKIHINDDRNAGHGLAQTFLVLNCLEQNVRHSFNFSQGHHPLLPDGTDKHAQRSSILIHLCVFDGKAV